MLLFKYFFTTYNSCSKYSVFRKKHWIQVKTARHPSYLLKTEQKSEVKLAAEEDWKWNECCWGYFTKVRGAFSTFDFF